MTKDHSSFLEEMVNEQPLTTMLQKGGNYVKNRKTS